MYQIRVTYGQLEIAVSSPTEEWAETVAKPMTDLLPELVEAEIERAGLVEEGDEDGDGE